MRTLPRAQLGQRLDRPEPVLFGYIIGYSLCAQFRLEGRGLGAATCCVKLEDDSRVPEMQAGAEELLWPMMD